MREEYDVRVAPDMNANRTEKLQTTHMTRDLPRVVAVIAVKLRKQWAQHSGEETPRL